MKCISIVSTQLQLLNCIEFVCQNNITDHTLLIYAASEKRLIQIKKVLQLPYVACKIQKTFFLLAYGRGSGYIRTLFNRARVRALFVMKQYDYCVICNYHNIAHRNLYRLASSNPNTQLVHLDDGLAIADCIELRKKELERGKPELVCSRSDKYLYNYCINKYVPKSILFFTPYKVNVTDVDKYVKNDYSYLKAQMLLNNIVNLSNAPVIILGQPIVAFGLLTKQQYSNCIERVLDSYGISKGPYMYLPHPVEDVTSSLEKRVANKITLLKSGLPFELLCTTINADALVMGFYTAALSCIKIFDIKCRVCAIHPQYNYKDEGERHVIETAYLHLRQIGINEIYI